MYKTILTPEECGMLVPHWPELNSRKLKRLGRMNTRTSKIISGQKISVMSPVGIIITEEPEKYILNGKHRAFKSFLGKFNLEAYVISGRNDIINHTPHKAYGEAGVEGVLRAFDDRYEYIQLCKNRGINT